MGVCTRGLAVRHLVKIQTHTLLMSSMSSSLCCMCRMYICHEQIQQIQPHIHIFKVYDFQCHFIASVPCDSVQAALSRCFVVQVFTIDQQSTSRALCLPSKHVSKRALADAFEFGIQWQATVFYCRCLCRHYCRHDCLSRISLLCHVGSEVCK